MREIITDWGVGDSFFASVFKNVQQSYGQGVTFDNNVIHLNHPLAKGTVDFVSLNNQVSLLRINVSFFEAVNFKRIVTAKPDYYACLFSLKEGVDFHAFSHLDEQETHNLGLSAKQSVLYYSSDVPTLFRVDTNAETTIIIIVFKQHALHEILYHPDSSNEPASFNGQSMKGYTSMSPQMLDIVTGISEHRGVADVDRLYLTGAVYELLATLLSLLRSENTLLAESTGVLEVARMLRVRNILVSDFSKDCPLLEEMAKKAQVSATKFKTLFKKLFRQPYYQYYQRNRLLSARHSIILGKSVSETAYEFGFGSISNFSVAFKKMFHMSPSEIEGLSNKVVSVSLPNA